MRRCGFCGNSGHNRATCPTLKEKIANDPNGYYARQAERKKVHRVRTSRPRLCSYCKTSGHNKATCTELTHDRFQQAKKNKDFGKTFIHTCKMEGFGPGSLMEIIPKDQFDGDNYQKERLQRDWDAHGPLAMVIGFQEKYLNSDLAGDRGYLGSREQVVRVRYPNGRTGRLALPVEFRDVAPESNGCRHGYWRIGCFVDASEIEKCFSSEWKAGKCGVEYQLGLENAY